MPCYRPLKGFAAVGGGITWSPRQGYVDRPMAVPCGQCIGCRLERSRQWAVRMMHHASLFDGNIFLTLTYDDEHLPYRGVLVKRHFQLFMKRLRKHFKGTQVSFFHCGEYGDESWRPHYHAILFNVHFPDRVCFAKNGRGEQLYTSPTLSRLWPDGLAVFGDVTFESCAYCARYCVKKVTGDAAAWYYRRMDLLTGELYDLPPEYATMSLRPGIGFDWLERFGSEVDASDSVVMRGREMKPPRYYDKKRSDPAMKIAKRRRLLDAVDRAADSTEARLKVRETVKFAQLKFLKRRL